MSSWIICRLTVFLCNCTIAFVKYSQEILIISPAGNQLAALGHVTTGSTISTISTMGVGVGVVGPTMEGIVELGIGIITAIPEVLVHRIGGISAVMLPPKVVTSCFLCLVNVTDVNLFYSLWWNKLNLGLLHWQYLASNMASSNWLVKCCGKACTKVFCGGSLFSGWTQLVVRWRIKTTCSHKMSVCKGDICRNHVLQCQTLCDFSGNPQGTQQNSFGLFSSHSNCCLFDSATAIFCCRCFQVQSKNVWLLFVFYA